MSLFLKLQTVHDVYGSDGNKQVVGDTFVRIDKIIAITDCARNMDDDRCKSLVYIAHSNADGWLEIPLTQTAAEVSALVGL